MAWPDLVAEVADRTTLEEGIRALRTAIPTGTCLLMTRVHVGLGQAAFEYFSLGDSAWVPSRNRYEPASAVKVMASVGALLTLGKHGLTGAAELDIEDDKFPYQGTLMDLVHRALVYSDNHAYNILMTIAGQDAMNGEYLTPANGFPGMALQSQFLKGPNPPFGDSPEIRFREGDRTGAIPARRRTVHREGCSKNCVTLAEMQEVVRKVLLHWEIPPADRFDLAPGDVAAIREFLFHARERFGEGPSKALGQPAVTYGRFGNIPGMSVFENGMVTLKSAGPFVPGTGMAVNVPRFLVTAAIPYFGRDDAASDQARKATSDVTEAALRVLLKRPSPGPLAQRNAGEPVAIQVDPEDVAGRHAIRLDVSKGASVHAWLGRTPLSLEEASPGRFVASAPLKAGRNALVVNVRRGARLVGYRAADLHKTP